jgi:2-aminoadipate transaminase
LKTEALLARRASRLPPTAAATATPDHHPISFDSGHAFPGVLPDLTSEAERALTACRAETLQYAPRPGLPELRDWIVEYMRRDGVANASLEETFVTNGAKHALELVCRLLLEEGDAIVVTAPTYFTAIPIFKSFAVEFIEVSQDGNGLNVSELEHLLSERKRAGRPGPKFIYDIPDFHNPSGVTMSRERRETLLALAEKNNILVIEDSPYRRVRFEGESQPLLKALDRSNSVLTLGTFSKLLAPGLRIGWVSGPRDLLNRMIQLKSDGGSCPLTQRIIFEFCSRGRLDSHIERVQKVYRAHRDRMVAAIRQQLPGVSLVVPQGGYYVWPTLPEPVDGDVLASRAASDGVILIPGSKFFAASGGSLSGGKAPKNHVRLAYSHATPAEIDAGLERLGKIYRSMN